MIYTNPILPDGVTGSTLPDFVSTQPKFKIKLQNVTPFSFDLYYQWNHTYFSLNPTADQTPYVGMTLPDYSAIEYVDIYFGGIEISRLIGGHSSERVDIVGGSEYRDKLTFDNMTAYQDANSSNPQGEAWGRIKHNISDWAIQKQRGAGNQLEEDFLPFTQGDDDWEFLCKVEYRHVGVAIGETPDVRIIDGHGRWEVYDVNLGQDNSIAVYTENTSVDSNWRTTLLRSTPTITSYDDDWVGDGVVVDNLSLRLDRGTSFNHVSLVVLRTDRDGLTSQYFGSRATSTDVERYNAEYATNVPGGYAGFDFDEHTLHLNGTYRFLYRGTYGGVNSVIKEVNALNVESITISDRGDNESDVAPNEPATGTIDGAALVRLEQNGGVGFSEPGVNIQDAEGDTTEWYYSQLKNHDTNQNIATWIPALLDDSPVRIALARLHNEQPVGTYRLYYIYRSTEGNLKQGTFYRDIEIYSANTPPDIKINTTTVYVPLGVDWDGVDSAGEKTYGGYTASDAEDSVDDLVVTIDQPGWESNKPGEYVFTYTVTDSQGETATGERTVIVLDPPTITTPYQIMPGIYDEGSVIFALWTALNRGDGVDENGDPVGQPQYTTFGNSKNGVNEHYGALTTSVADNIDKFANGTARAGRYDVVYRVTDLAGQYAESTSILVVGDVDEPVDDKADLSISAYASVVTSGSNLGNYKFTIALGSGIDHAHIKIIAASTGDQYDLMPAGTSGASTNTYIDSDNLNIDHGNFHWEVWGVDSSHNRITEIISGTIYREEVDNEAPVITLYVENSPPADGDATVTLTQGTIYDESVHGGYRVTDDTDSIVGVTTSPKNIPDTPGTYTITYTATDTAGNTTTATRDVIITEAVKQADPPTISLNGDSVVYHQSGTAYSDLGATALDSNGADITGSVQSDVAVFEGNYLSTPGTYTITYSVTDPYSGLSATVQRTVTVHSVPVITLIGGSTVHVELYGTPWSEPGYTASEDGVDRYDDVVVTGTVDDSTAGTYTLTYTLTDSEDASITTSVTRIVNVMVKGCPAVEDLSLISGAPNLSGIVVANNSLINYLGQSVDVSNYTSGQWESLSQNVGIITGHIERSAIDVGSIDIAGVATSLLDPSLWTAFPIDTSTRLNLTAYAKDRNFSRGIGVNQDGTNPAIEETIIKFVSLTKEKLGSAQSALELFETLSSSQFDYPFDWHCALDSSFSAQDVVLMASSELTIPRLSEETLYPKEFIEWRLSTLVVDGSIDPGAFQRKKYGLDGHGLIDSKGEKIPLPKLAEKSPKAAEYLKVGGSKLDDNPPKKTSLATPKTPARPVSTSRQFWDRMHNRSTEEAPDQYITRKPKYPVMPANPTTVLRSSSSTIVNGVNNYMADHQETALYLGTMYSNEASGRNRGDVLEAITAKASELGLDISSYTGG
tara:strand:+ start:2378 stop:6619 length:4242 start_codon:yes stop_codon:yes gene_type:complete